MTGRAKSVKRKTRKDIDMRALLLVAAIPFLASAAPPSKPPGRVNVVTGEVCMTPPLRSAHSAGDMLRRSDEPVTFDLHHAVLRRVDGCIVPAILRRNVDGGRSSAGSTKARR